MVDPAPPAAPPLAGTVRSLTGADAVTLVTGAWAHGRSLPASSWSTSVLGPAAALAALGRDHDARSVRDGGLRAALAHDRSSRPTLRARRERDACIVEGVAPLVVGAGAARLVVVTAALDGGGHAAGVLSTDDPAVRCTPVRAIGDDDVADVHVDGASLASARIDAARSPLVDVGWLVTLAVAAELAGVAAVAIERAVAYVNERHQFGQRIAAFQSVQHRLADALIDAVAMHDAVVDAATRVDAGADATGCIVRAKQLASVGARRVVATAQQVHGGAGYYDDAPLPRVTRRAIALARRSGDPDALLARLAGLPPLG